MSKRIPINDGGTVIAYSEAGFTTFQMEEVGPSTMYFVRKDGQDWVEVGRDAYLAAIATALHEELAIGLGSISQAIQDGGRR